MWWTVLGIAVTLVVTGLVVRPVVARLRARRAGRLAEDRRAEVAVRVADGAVTGLGRQWVHGVLTFRPEHLEFRGTVGGVRLVRRRALQLTVLEVVPGAPEVSGWSSAWSLLPGCEVSRLRTRDAVVDVAVPPGGDRVRAMLKQMVVPDGPVGGSRPDPT